MMYRHVVLYLKIAAFHCKAVCIPMLVEMIRISIFIYSYVGNTKTRRHADYSFFLIFQLVIISSNTFPLGKSSYYIVSFLQFNMVELDYLSHLTLFKYKTHTIILLIRKWFWTLYHSFNSKPIEAINFNFHMITVLIREGEQAKS